MIKSFLGRLLKFKQEMRIKGSAPLGKESELEKVAVGKKVTWKNFLPTATFSNSFYPV